MKLHDLKNALSSIQNRTVDTFSLCRIAHDLNMTIPSGADELRLQRLIIREILIHIIREDPADEFLKNLKEVESNIISRQCFGYYCSMAGCIFTTDRHKKYINHLRRVHFINKNFLCNYKKKCKQLFRNLDTLVDKTMSNIFIRKIVMLIQ